MRQVFEVAGDAVLVLGEEDVVLAALGGGDSGQEAWPIGHRRARYRRVGIGRDNLYPLRGRVAHEGVNLVGDGECVLAVGGVAGVQRGAGVHRGSPRAASASPLATR